MVYILICSLSLKTVRYNSHVLKKFQSHKFHFCYAVEMECRAQIPLVWFIVRCWGELLLWTFIKCFWFSRKFVIWWKVWIGVLNLTIDFSGCLIELLLTLNGIPKCAASLDLGILGESNFGKNCDRFGSMESLVSSNKFTTFYSLVRGRFRAFRA